MFITLLFGIKIEFAKRKLQTICRVDKNKIKNHTQKFYLCEYGIFFSLQNCYLKFSN